MEAQTTQGKLGRTLDMIARDAETHGDSAILMCSFGKDSLAALDMCYGKYRRLVCVFMYFVKGLEHVEKWIRWAKARYPRAEFVQVPHWTLSYLLRSGLYCVAQPKIRLIKLSDVVKSLRLRYGIETVILGMKRADGMNRRLMLGTYEKLGYRHKGMFYPLAEWTQKEVLAYMKMRSIPEPVRYSLKASSGVGFGEDCFVWMEKNCPGDLEKIYEVFPLSRRILFEYHEKEKREFLKKCRMDKEGQEE